MISGILNKFKRKTVTPPSPPTDRDLRAVYKFAYDCHIILVEQFDARGKGQWKMVTNLCVGSEVVGTAVAKAITLTGRVDNYHV